MKKISLFILVFLFSMQIFAQEKHTVAVAASNLNVLYIGVDNPLDIAVAGVEAEAISVTISHGNIKKTAHNYIVTVTKEEDATIKIYKDKELLGTKNFRIKQLPAPIPTLGNDNLKGGSYTKEKLLNSKRLNAIDYTPFDAKYTITGFTITTMKNGYESNAHSNNNYLTAQQISLIQNLATGEKFYIENIRAKGPSGNVLKLRTMSIKIDGPYVVLERKNNTALNNNAEVKISDLMMYELSLKIEKAKNGDRVQSFQLSYFDGDENKTITLFSVTAKITEPMKQAMQKSNNNDFVFINIVSIDNSFKKDKLPDFKFTINR